MSEKFKMDGVVKSVIDVREGLLSDKTTPYKTVKVVLEETGKQYPSSFIAEIFKKGEYIQHADKLASVDPETKVSVELTFKAEQSTTTGKWFQRISIWSIKIDDSVPAAGEKEIEQAAPEQAFSINDDNPDDLPF